MEEDTEVKVEIGHPEQEFSGFPTMPMPDFSGMIRPLGFFSWIPFIITAIAVFIAVSLFQLAFNILTQPDAPITYSAVFTMLVISLVLALLFGFLAKYLATRAARPIRIE